MQTCQNRCYLAFFSLAYCLEVAASRFISRLDTIVRLKSTPFRLLLFSTVATIQLYSMLFFT